MLQNIYYSTIFSLNKQNYIEKIFDLCMMRVVGGELC